VAAEKPYKRKKSFHTLGVSGPNCLHGRFFPQRQGKGGQAEGGERGEGKKRSGRILKTLKKDNLNHLGLSPRYSLIRHGEEKTWERRAEGGNAKKKLKQDGANHSSSSKI